MPRFHGVIVPTVTLFREDGSIDWEANARHLDRLIGCGVDALFVLGTTGEAQHLSFKDRADIICWAAEHVAGRAPLLAGIGDTSAAVSLELIRVAEDAGADAVVAIPPFFWVLSERHLYAHFLALANSTRLPLLLYNFPQLTGVNLSVDLVRRLADDCPNLVGIKETLDSGTHMRQMANGVKRGFDGFSVLCGHDDLVLFALTAGLDGCVSSTANFAPEVFVDLYRSYRAGNFAVAEAASAKIGRLVEAYGADPCGAAVVKAALHLRGWIDGPGPRPPALPLTEDGYALIRDLLQETGLMETRK